MIPIKNSTSFPLYKILQANSKFYLEMQRASNIEENVEKGGKNTGGFILVDNKIFCKATVIKRALFFCKGSPIYQKIRAESVQQPVYT